MAGAEADAPRICAAVEAALSDILLLGTDDQLRLAAQAAEALVAGHRVHMAELVASLRDFVSTTSRPGADSRAPEHAPTGTQSNFVFGQGRRQAQA